MQKIERSRLGWIVAWGVLTAIALPIVFVQGQNAGDWQTGAVEDLSAGGLDTGFPDGSFLAEESLTGYQAAVLVSRLLEQVGQRTGCPDPMGDTGGGAAFADVPNDHWAATAVADVAALNVADAFPGGTFDGDDYLTGYQTALLLSRALAVVDTSVACGERVSDAELSALRAEFSALRADVEAGALVGPE